MSTETTGNPIRLWVSKRSVELVSVEGRNHAKLPGRNDLFPLFDYAWRVTVFSVDGLWYRVDNTSQECEARMARLERDRLQRAQDDEKASSEIAALQAQVTELTRQLSNSKAFYEAEMARKEADFENQKLALLASRSDSSLQNNIKSYSSSSLPSDPGNHTTSTPPSPAKSQFFVAKRPQSISVSQRLSSGSMGSDSPSSTPPGSFKMPGSHRQAAAVSLIGLTAPAPLNGHSLPYDQGNSLPAMSTSLPSMSPLSSMMYESPPVSPQTTRIEKPDPVDLLGTSPRAIETGSPRANPGQLSASLRRVSSLPPVATDTYVITDSSKSPSTTVTPRSAASTVTPRVPSAPNALDFDIPESDKWTKAQCEEWLSSKLYPSVDPSDKSSSGQRAIHCASLDGQLQVVEYLIARGGVDVAQKDLMGNTPLICAASKGRLETVQWLLSHGASLTAKAPSGRSPLHSAAAGGFMPVCELLITLGADPLDKEQFGKTPRALAEAYQHKPVAEFLKSAEMGNKVVQTSV